MLRVKGADTLLPIGPGLVRGVNLFEQTLRTYVNGLVVQEAHIGDETIWGPHYVIADLARHITLVPGDVILMGTPCHSRSVDPGDLVECEITAIGRVSGTVVAIDAPRASGLGVGHAPTNSAEVRRVALGFDERVPERFKDNLRKTRRG
jgi:5-oxopent-3-ene-1,2,5-tricarboxylate decarboxylase/2-hydroxyhepta-2,4-diene-1,7-dioate isomerase